MARGGKTPMAAAALLLLLAGQPAAPAESHGKELARLAPGQHVVLPSGAEPLVQRLTGCVYWATVAGYNTLFLVGKTGVLLFDPLDANAAPKLLAAIAGVTNLPVTAILYSHHHLDHIGGAKVIADGAAKAGRELRIYGTPLIAAEIARFGGHVPQPTELLAAPRSQFTFDGVLVEVITLDPPGHSRDSTIAVIPSERVVNFTDAFDPGWLPFVDFGIAQDPAALCANLQTLRQMDWDFLNTGHGNVGSPHDVDVVLEYLRDAWQATATAMSHTDYAAFEVPGRDHISVFNAYRAQVVAQARALLLPRYDKQYGFEAAVPSHIEAIINELMFSGD